MEGCAVSDSRPVCLEECVVAHDQGTIRPRALAVLLHRYLAGRHWSVQFVDPAAAACAPRVTEVAVLHVMLYWLPFPDTDVRG